MMQLLAVATEKSAVKGFFGALHPGVVHFPIALLAVAALFEIVQILRKRREPAPGTQPLAWLAAVSAVFASAFGLILEDYEGAAGSLVDLHKWLGLGSTFVALAAAVCAIKARTSSGALAGLRVSLILGSGLVLATGYMGGELVFGEGHLFKFFRAEVKKDPPSDPQAMLKPAVSDKVDFAQDIVPVIREMCFKCHGGEKVKGKFKLNTKKEAMEGGESGKAILPGKPTLSKFYTSMTLGKDDEELMPPPKEKARPTPEQIEKVRKWIEQGAEWPDGFEFKK